MNNPLDELKVMQSKNWQVGDQRAVPAEALDGLRGTEAYNSYDQLYRIDGLNWRLEDQISRPDGKTLYFLRCMNE